MQKTQTEIEIEQINQEIEKIEKLSEERRHKRILRIRVAIKKGIRNVELEMMEEYFFVPKDLRQPVNRVYIMKIDNFYEAAFGLRQLKFEKFLHKEDLPIYHYFKDRNEAEAFKRACEGKDEDENIEISLKINQLERLRKLKPEPGPPVELPPYRTKYVFRGFLILLFVIYLFIRS